MNPFGLFRSVIGTSRLSCLRALNTHTGLEKRLLTQQAKFEFHHGDYEKQCLHALGRKDKAGMVMNNPNQSVFLFMDRQHLQVSLFADAVPELS